MYNTPVCRGSWGLGTACGKCERCKDTRPMTKPDSADKPVSRQDDDVFTEFEQGERAALLQLRSFIIRAHFEKKPFSEVDAYCAQRLNDIRMDASHRAAKEGKQG